VVTPFIQQAAWARAVFGVSVVAFAVGEFSQAVKVRRHASHTDLRGEVVFRCVFFSGIVMLPLAQAVAPGAVLEGPAPFLLGMAVGWLGLGLRWWSFATLGTYFTTVVKTSTDQVIVNRGPYRLVRHPSYTGLLAAFLGGGLMLGNWIGVCASSLLVLLSLLYRIRREEHAMVRAFGEAYLTFAHGRARLVPFIW
jgi:protein-S-isoprenylcysteine O-methyltransferase Ste14